MKRQNTHRRGPMTILAIILLVAMILTGTFAWSSISQQALNLAEGQSGILPDAGGRLHDHFEDMEHNDREWLENTTANKDIFIENFRGDGEDIFVRIRLFEFMSINGTSLVPTASRNDHTTWTPRLNWLPELTGAPNTPASPFRNYWSWALGGQTWYIPTFNQNPNSRASDVRGAAIDPQFPTPVDPFGPEAGGANGQPWFTGPGTHAGQIYDGVNPLQNAILDARQTANASVILMSDWNNVPGPFWVVDPVDGWIYWAQAVPAETSTGLLLDRITFRGLDRGDETYEWFYGIFVDAQMSLAGNWSDYFTRIGGELDMTQNGENLLNIITNPMTFNVTPASATVEPGETQTFTASANRGSVAFPVDQVTWEIIGANPDNVTLSAATGASTTLNVPASANDQTLTLRATFAVGVSRDITVTIETVEELGLALMRGGLGVLQTPLPSPENLFLTFPNLYREQVERVEVVDFAIAGRPSRFDVDAWMSEWNALGGFQGRQIIDAVDLTHPDSVSPVVAFYTEGSVTSRYYVYLAGNGGVAATGQMNSFFRGLTNATSMSLAELDTSRVTDMTHMFSFAGVETLDLSAWDTSNVTIMNSMFSITSNLTTLNVSGWDTSNVTDMGNVFTWAVSLTTLDLSSWDTANVTNMTHMFWRANGLTSVDFRLATFARNPVSETMFDVGAGPNTIILGSEAARSFVESRPGWDRTPARTIIIAN